MIRTETPEQIARRYNLRLADWFCPLDQVAEWLDDYGAFIATTPTGKITYTTEF